MDKNSVCKTNSFYWDTKGNDYPQPIVQMLCVPPDIARIDRLHSLSPASFFPRHRQKVGIFLLKQMLHKKEARLLLRRSEKQIERARQYLTACGLSAKLICSPMEEECGIPVDYFDFVYSIYAIGWTTDLEGTFYRIASYLKKDGIFIFSWSHPIHKCVVAENNMLAFKI